MTGANNGDPGQTMSGQGQEPDSIVGQNNVRSDYGWYRM